MSRPVLSRPRPAAAWPLPPVVGDTVLAVAVGALALATAGLSDFDDRRPGGFRGDHGDRGGPGGPGGPPRVLDAVDPTQLGALLVLVAGLALRRTAPRAAAAAVLAGLAVFLLAGGPYGPVLLGPALAVHALLTRCPPRRSLPFLLALPVSLSAGFWREPWGGLTDPGLYLAVVLASAAVLLPALVALNVSTRRAAERQDALAERRRHVDEERLQMAREVHDLVGHSLAVINLQAGVALHVLDKRPDQLAPALEAIRSTSKTALAELGSALATFRGDLDRVDASAPDPSSGGSLADLDRLVSALQAAGRTVRLTRPPADLLRLPPAVEHAALRIAQEGLTNVVRHATATATLTVTVARAGDTLVVEVLDDGAPAPTPFVEGSGVAGIRARARAVGGTVTVGPRRGGGFGVRAELPCAAQGAAR